MFLPFRRYFDFSGRSRRREYWQFTLLYILVLIALGAVMVAGFPFSEWAATPEPDFDKVPMQPAFWLGAGGLFAWWLATFIPLISVAVRRFHDQGRSGWMYLIYFVPYVGWLIVLVFMCL